MPRFTDKNVKMWCVRWKKEPSPIYLKESTQPILEIGDVGCNPTCNIVNKAQNFVQSDNSFGNF